MVRTAEGGGGGTIGPPPLDLSTGHEPRVASNPVAAARENGFGIHDVEGLRRLHQYLGELSDQVSSIGSFVANDVIGSSGLQDNLIEVPLREALERLQPYFRDFTSWTVDKFENNADALWQAVHDYEVQDGNVTGYFKETPEMRSTRIAGNARRRKVDDQLGGSW